MNKHRIICFAGCIAGLFFAGCQSAPSRPPIHYKVIPHGSETRSLHEMEKKPAAPAEATRNAVTPGSKRELVKEECYRWMGAPYRIGGSAKTGVDCSGFTTQVYLRTLGIKLPRTAAQQFNYGSPVSTAQLLPGDLVFFKTSSEAPVTHVGIYLGDGQFAHSATKHGVIVTNLSDWYYSQAYRGARRALN